MSDIFISYAQKAPEPTQALAADLGRLKYTYWFDERLLPIEVFGQVINENIDKAKAVITIWTEPALKSKWVYAEALRADDQNKLLSVHTPDVKPGSIPVPFNAGHVSQVGDRTAIYEALARLGVHPGGVTPLDHVARAYEHIENSTDIEDFEAFLADFEADGKQFYIRLAKKRIAALQVQRGGIVMAKPAEIAEVPLPQAGDVFLRIEPGMHTAVIRQIGLNAAGTLMATGSDDKTARLWALPQGGHGSPELLRTLRVPIGGGYEGRIYAVALSPDGKWMAASGWDADYVAVGSGTVSVYIFEAATGRLVTRLGGLDNVVLHLAFSPDGSRVAATLGTGEGVRVWDAASWRLVSEDKDYGGKNSYGAAFDSANRLYTVAFDGQIRRYGANGRLEAKAAAQGGKVPFSIAVHPSGMKLAVGFDDSTAMEVYDAGTLKLLYAADTAGIAGGSLCAAAWSADGTRLYAGGRYQSEGALALVIWQEEGRGRRSQVSLAQNTIMQLLPCGDGVAAGAQDPAFGVVAMDGAKQVWQEGVTADLRDQRDMFGLSADGKKARFTLKWRSEPVLFDLATFQLSDAPEAVTGVAIPRTSGLAVTDWENNTGPRLNGEPIILEDYERAFSLAINPNASQFVLGTHFRLRAYRSDGGQLWQKQVPGVTWGVNISGDGKLVAAAYGDGSIRWHRLSDGQELLALFVHAKDRRFIAWTPEGYYAASPGAEDLIGWHVNRGFDVAPDFYPASTFASTFRRPDIVKAALGIDSGATLLKAESLIDKVRKLF
jgi:WD40 repeat protein